MTLCIIHSTARFDSSTQMAIKEKHWWVLFVTHNEQWIDKAVKCDFLTSLCQLFPLPPLSKKARQPKRLTYISLSKDPLRLIKPMGSYKLSMVVYVEIVSKCSKACIYDPYLTNYSVFRCYAIYNTTCYFVSINLSFFSSSTRWYDSIISFMQTTHWTLKQGSNLWP